MSWFRFSAPSSSEDQSAHGEQDNGQISQGKGVKGDLSELTKTFSKQLWGVASFLAPPPSIKSTKEQLDPGPLLPAHDQQNEPFKRVDEITLSNELVGVDFQASVDASDVSQVGSPPLSGQSNPRCTTPHGSSDNRLAGVGKDLAELKGSVAIGFSKILKVVREEIDRDVHGKDLGDNGDVDADDDEEEEGSESHLLESSHRELPVFNSLLRPLFSSILQNDRDAIKRVDVGFDEEDEEGIDDDPFDAHGQQLSRPLAGLNLQHALDKSLDGISQFASNIFPVSLDSDDEHDATGKKQIHQAVGVTEEVLTFARNISMHPETWLDFPLFTDDAEDDDFQMSDAQREHVRQVELASPRLAALRIELCPDYMSEGRFWKIYFVLLHSRLSKNDAVLLSTPQIMEARALLLSNLQKKESPESKSGQSESKGKGVLSPTSTQALSESFKIVSLQSAMEVPAKDFDQFENAEATTSRPQASASGGPVPLDSAEEVQNKNVLASTVKLAALNYEEEEADADRWLDEEASSHIPSTAAAALGNDEDVSFSDLEEEEVCAPTKGAGSSNTKRSQGWVELDDKDIEKSVINGKKSANQPSDWLTIGEDDVTSADFV